MLPQHQTVSKPGGTKFENKQTEKWQECNL